MCDSRNLTLGDVPEKYVDLRASEYEGLVEREEVGFLTGLATCAQDTKATRIASVVFCESLLELIVGSVAIKDVAVDLVAQLGWQAHQRRGGLISLGAVRW